MATRKPKPQNLSQRLQFIPIHGGDPVPWPFLSQFERATQVQIAQIQLELHRQTLRAQLDATNRISAVIKTTGKK